jgi:hypothetical protein
MKKNEDGNFKESLKLKWKEIFQKAVTLALFYAQRCLPALKGDSFASYFEPFHHMYQKQLDENNQAYPAADLEFKGIQAGHLAKREIQRLVNALHELKNKLIEVVLKIEQLNPSRRSRLINRILVVYIMLVICFGDVILNVNAFQDLALPYWECEMMAIIFGCILALIAHLIPKILVLVESTTTKWVIIIIIAIAAFYGFWEMGELRSAFIERNSPDKDKIIQIGSFAFAVISMLLFGSAVAVSFLYFPTKEEMDVRHKYEAINREKNNLERDITAIKKEITNVERNMSDVQHECSEKLSEGQSNEQQILAEANSTFSEVKNSNQKHREDGLTPDCQNMPYPFQFHTYFNFRNRQNKIA